MRISKFKIKNYKSFKETDEIELTSGINLITGQNNSGKTPLLEALSTRFNSIAHRSSKSQPTPSHAVNQFSEIDIEFKADKEEIIHQFLNSEKNQFLIRSIAGMDYYSMELSELLNKYFPGEVNIDC